LKKQWFGDFFLEKKRFLFEKAMVGGFLFEKELISF